MHMSSEKPTAFTMKPAAWGGIAALVLLAACSSTGSKTDSGSTAELKGKAVTEPAELVFYNPASAYGVDGFNEKYGNALRKKFPGYTFTYIPVQQGKLEDLLLNGTRFDIVFNTIGNFEEAVLNNNLQVDMTGLISKHKVDLSAIEPTIIEAVKQASGGKLYGLPVFMNNIVTYYNKALFDKFAVAYPRDGLTWEDMAALSAKLTRVDNGIQYYGYSTSVSHILRMNQMSLPSVSPGTDTPTIYKDPKWKSWFESAVLAPIQPYRDKLKQSKQLPNHTQQFLKEQNLAVYVYLTTLLSTYLQEMKAMNWDMVTMPSFKELPGVTAQAYPTYFGITKMAKNQDAAMEVITYLVSEEFQKEEGRQGLTTILRSEAVKNVLLKESEFKDKNLNAIFKNKFAPITPKELYDAQLVTVYSQVANNVLWGDAQDINTALRQAEEQSVKKIQEFKAQKK
ncbi:MAG: extracellular solute-binding protein family 1 [Paenibacillus sp.]|nr:extracellular solute-binding protein family 1 [Paenibacillus sp.]